MSVLSQMSYYLDYCSFKVWNQLGIIPLIMFFFLACIFPVLVFCFFFFFLHSMEVLGSGLFSHSVVSASLRPLGLQHARPPCPSPTPKACSNSCPQVSDAIQPSHPLSSPSQMCYFLLKACWTFDRNCTESTDKLPS